MKKTLVNWLKQEGLYFGLSILLPMMLMAIGYAAVGVYWGSEQTILASDAFSQGANFLASFNDMLHGKASPFYSWYGSLGLNYWALSAYYMNGIFTPLVYFFDNSQIPDVFYLLTLLKFGAAGGAFWWMGRRLFSGLPQTLLVALSMGYALSAFPITSSPMLMWLDTMMYLPLIILGIHRLFEIRKPVLLFISYLLLFLTNFYMAFMVGVFSFLYMLCLVLIHFKDFKQQIPLYLLTAFLAGGASMVIILPTILDLMNNGEGLTKVGQFLTIDTGPWDLIVKNMTGIYDTTRFGSAPFISFGLLGLPFATAYFFLKQIPRRNKLVFGGLLVILILSVYIDPLNLFWHGFHAPNMFLFRFAFLFSFLGALLAGQAMAAVTKDNFEKVLNSTILWILLFAAASLLANRKRYDYLSRTNLIVSIIILLVYLACFWGQFHWVHKKSRYLLPVILFVTCVEGGYQASELLKNFNGDWGYPPRAQYEKDYADIKALVTTAKEQTPEFHRLETLDYSSTNQSFKYGYSGIGMFSSIRNRRSSSYLDQLGFRSKGSNLRVEYRNNTLIMDALFGVQYNISKKELRKFGFDQIEVAGEFQLYQNKYTLPLGLMTDERVFSKKSAQTQESLLQQLADRQDRLFSVTEPELVAQEDVNILEEEGIVTFNEATVGKPRKVTYQVDVPAKGQAYLMLYGENTLAGMGKANAHVNVEGIKRNGGLVNEGQFFDLGYYDKLSTIEAEVEFTGNTQTVLRKPTVIILDTESYQQAVTAAQAKDAKLQVNGRKVMTTVTTTEDQVLFTTIPYDKGWQVTVDGIVQPIKPFQEAFVTVKLPKGTHEVVFTYLPQGFRLGAGLFLSCTLLFAGSEYYRRRKSMHGMHGKQE